LPFGQAGQAGINWGQTALTSLMAGHLLPARVTHLEMTSPYLDGVTPPEIVQPVGAQAHITQVKNCPVHFYHYLYDRIGRHHHWGQRLKLPDDVLSNILCAPETILYLLSLDGCPAGFCEMSLNNWPDVDIVYFGLMREFQGQGWGRFFLSKMIEYGWSLKPQRLTIQTNTLDSPQALKLYQAVGFHVTKVRDVMMEAVLQRVGQTVLRRIL